MKMTTIVLIALLSLGCMNGKPLGSSISIWGARTLRSGGSNFSGSDAFSFSSSGEDGGNYGDDFSASANGTSNFASRVDRGNNTAFGATYSLQLTAPVSRVIYEDRREEVSLEQMREWDHEHRYDHTHAIPVDIPAVSPAPPTHPPSVPTEPNKPTEPETSSNPAKGEDEDDDLSRVFAWLEGAGAAAAAWFAGRYGYQRIQTYRAENNGSGPSGPSSA